MDNASGGSESETTEVGFFLVIENHRDRAVVGVVGQEACLAILRRHCPVSDVHLPLSDHQGLVGHFWAEHHFDPANNPFGGRVRHLDGGSVRRSCRSVV